VARVTVVLPPPLLRLFPTAEPRVALEATTVAAAIAALDARWPGLRDRLCDSTPRIRRTVNVFVAGRKAALETELSDGAEVLVLPAVIG
jgi:molybdopterin converting factor small subunit